MRFQAIRTNKNITTHRVAILKAILHLFGEFEDKKIDKDMRPQPGREWERKSNNDGP